jgi:hypothetical protein
MMLQMSSLESQTNLILVSFTRTPLGKNLTGPVQPLTTGTVKVLTSLRHDLTPKAQAAARSTSHAVGVFGPTDRRFGYETF